MAWNSEHDSENESVSRMSVECQLEWIFILWSGDYLQRKKYRNCTPWQWMHYDSMTKNMGPYSSGDKSIKIS